MIDNETGKATRVDVRPLTVAGMLRTSRRDRPLLVGFLLVALIEAAQRLWPEFKPEREEMKTHTLEKREPAEPATDFRPVWRRHREGQGIAEYALILALIAVVSIIVLLALGGAIAQALSQIGASI